jgi:CheY-like chemotaxis protein
MDDNDLVTNVGIEYVGEISPLVDYVVPINVLVVDDEQVHRDNMYFCLRDCVDDAKIDLAEDGLQASEMVQGAEKPYDIIFTDFHMPTRDGGAFLRSISTYDHSLKFMVTAEPSPEIYRDAIKAGVVGLIRKPMSLDTLETLLSAHEEGMKADEIRSAHQNLLYVPPQKSLN